MIKRFITWLINLFRTPQIMKIRKKSNKHQSLKKLGKEAQEVI